MLSKIFISASGFLCLASTTNPPSKTLWIQRRGYNFLSVLTMNDCLDDQNYLSLLVAGSSFDMVQ